MEQLDTILEQILPNTDFRHAKNLVDSKLLTSLNIVKLVAALNEAFDIEITPLHLVPENFNSVEAIWALVQKLDEE